MHRITESARLRCGGGVLSRVQPSGIHRRIPEYNIVDHMNNQTDVILFDTAEIHENLLPLSYTRPIADFRIGIDTIREKWEALLPGRYAYLPVEYLRAKFGTEECHDRPVLHIAGNVIPNREIVEAVSRLHPGESLRDSHGLVAACCSESELENFLNAGGESYSATEYRRINYVFDIFLLNARTIAEDYIRRVEGRKSAELPETVTVLGDRMAADGTPMVFLEEGARVEGVIINVKNGPVYIGKDAEVWEGSCIRGPLAICEKGKVRMGAKIYGGTTLGPYCKVGGEVDNAVLFGYSNKAHDGYLGNAVIGEWCNLGAGTNASNLKNDYAKIRIWNYATQRFMRTDLQFCGLIMGDHSKAGVNCMFNTATVVGVGVNIHGAGFPRVFVPSFSEGSAEAGFSNVTIDKFMTTASRVMSRRGLDLTDVDRDICEYIYNSASRFKSKR